jgi:hypothetical protein
LVIGILFSLFSATLEGDELAERVGKNRVERFEWIRLGGVKTSLLSRTLVHEWQQCIDRLTDVGPAKSSFVAIVVRRSPSGESRD